MKVTQTLTYANDSFTVVLNAPTMNNAGALVTFGRKFLLKAAKDNFDAIPDMEFLEEGVSAIKPLVVSFKNAGDVDVDLDDLSLPAANFLATVAIEHFTNTLNQSAIKKK